VGHEGDGGGRPSGRVPLSGKVKAGDYKDTLVVTLNF
jgi:spore coat protein U-like protein